MMVCEELITQDLLNTSLDYSSYRKLLIDLFEEGKTTGNDHSDSMLNYAKLNLQRMKKWDKIAKLSDELQLGLNKIEKKQDWVVLTEGWCGDAAQNLPVINKIAEGSEQINLRLLLRDENLDVMDCYLTNGGRSIPKLIILDSETKKELGTWGPRPEPAQKVMQEMKDAGNFSYAEFSEKTHAWYAKDKSQTLQKELLSILESIEV